MPVSPAPAERIITNPKAELHIHIEGSLESELMFALAECNGAKPSYASVEEVRAAYAFNDLQSFPDLYYVSASVLLTEQDFYGMTAAYIACAFADNVHHVEIFFNPQTYTARNMFMHVVVHDVVRAPDDAEHEHDFSSTPILCFLRHPNEEDAFDALEAALPYIQDPANCIIDVGPDLSERGNPLEKSARVFARCKEPSLRLVAHAGEEGSAQYATGALNIFEVECTDHGVHVIDDAALVKHLAAERIALTVCPLSNEKLKVYPNPRDHSLKQLLDVGCAVTLHSDDPAYFGGYMNTDWLATFNALDLSVVDVHMLVRNNFEASFLPEQDKALWPAKVDDHWEAVHQKS